MKKILFFIYWYGTAALVGVISFALGKGNVNSLFTLVGYGLLVYAVNITFSLALYRFWKGKRLLKTLLFLVGVTVSVFAVARLGNMDVETADKTEGAVGALRWALWISLLMTNLAGLLSAFFSNIFSCGRKKYTAINLGVFPLLVLCLFLFVYFSAWIAIGVAAVAGIAVMLMMADASEKQVSVEPEYYVGNEKLEKIGYNRYKDEKGNIYRVTDDGNHYYVE